MRIHYQLKFRDYFYFNAAYQFLLVTSQVLYLGLDVLVYIGESSTTRARAARAGHRDR